MNCELARKFILFDLSEGAHTMRAAKQSESVCALSPPNGVRGQVKAHIMVLEEGREDNGQGK